MKRRFQLARVTAAPVVAPSKPPPNAAGDVVPVPFAIVQPILEKFARVHFDGSAAVVTFANGEIADQVVVELDSNATFTEICLPRAQSDDRFLQLTFRRIEECSLCFFDEGLKAVYATRDITRDVPPSLPAQTARGVVVVAAVSDLT